MSRPKRNRIHPALLILTFLFAIAALGQTTSSTIQSQKDSARTATVEDMAKRVDSLQFIVVYNAELLRRDLDSKMMLMYVMLGIIIIASMLMYGLLKQNQRQRKQLEEDLMNRLSTSVADLEAKIRRVEEGMPPPKTPKAPKTPVQKKKRE
jgi:hypothetical protein